MPPLSTEEKKDRIRGALWGLLIGDALAMPVHWYYNRENLKRDYDGGVRGFVPPHNPHPGRSKADCLYCTGQRMTHLHLKESMTELLPYKPNPNCSVDVNIGINKPHLFAEENKAGGHVDEHGNQLQTPPNQRIHYHGERISNICLDSLLTSVIDGLHAGENTLMARIVRLLVQYLGQNKSYNKEGFVESLRQLLTTKGAHNDTYLEVWVRRWFEKFSYGTPIEDCAAKQKDIWSIGSSTGICFGVPILLMNLSESLDNALEKAHDHQRLTHKSENVESATKSLAKILWKVINEGVSPKEAILEVSKRDVHLPKIAGFDLLQRYRDAKGPSRIPKDEMYRLHTELKEETFDPLSLMDKDDETVVGDVISHACYTEHGFPAALYLATKYGSDIEKALLSNANCGGDNTNRGMVLGALVGSLYGTSAIPEKLMTGIYQYEEIKMEIDAFVDFVQV